jgi:hypothetical protein
MRLNLLLRAAVTSSWAKYKLNFILARMIPFNSKHGIKVNFVESNKVITYIPYNKVNFNHLRGIHACAIATIGEYCAGLLLLQNVDADAFRLIMSNLQVSYHFQAKTECTAIAEVAAEEIAVMQQQLAVTGKCDIKMTAEIYDAISNHIATVVTVWQIKSWQLVRTK